MIRTAGYNLLGKTGAAALSFGLILLVSRLLGAEARGYVGSYLVVIALITAVSDFAGGSAVTYLSNRLHAGRLLRRQMWWTTIIALAAFVPVYLQSAALTDTLLLVTAAWLNTAWSLQQHFLLGWQRFRQVIMRNTAAPALALLLFITFYFLHWRQPIAVLTAFTLAWAILWLQGIIILKPFFKETNTKIPYSFSLVLKTAGTNQAAHVISLLQSRLIFFLLPAAGLGAWSNVLTLSEAVFLIPGSIGQIMYGVMVGKRNHNTQQQDDLAKPLAITAGGVAIACSVLYFLPASFWVLLFGGDFVSFPVLIKPVLPAIFCYAIYLFFSYRLSAMGLFAANLYATLAGFLVNLGLTGYFLLQDNYQLGNGVRAFAAGWMVCFLVIVAIYFIPKRKN